MHPSRFQVRKVEDRLINAESKKLNLNFNSADNDDRIKILKNSILKVVDPNTLDTLINESAQSFFESDFNDLKDYYSESIVCRSVLKWSVIKLLKSKS